jgi:uncharacterized protein YecE (DUF72 family)
MIKIGVTGWGDHDSLYPDGTPARDKLAVYSGHFPIVEVDFMRFSLQKTMKSGLQLHQRIFPLLLKRIKG